MQEIKAGQQVSLADSGGEINPKDENLPSGRYEISVDFVGSPRKVIGTTTGTFEVVNPDYQDPSTLARNSKVAKEKLSAYARELYSSVKLGELSIGSYSVKKGVVIQASCI